MVLREGTSQQYWRRVLTSEEFTAMPRWTLNPVKGIDKKVTTINGDLVAALRRLADELGVSFNSILLAAHAKVLTVLSGEQVVATGYVALEGGQPLPCRLMTVAETWRKLLLDTHQAETDLLFHKDFLVDDLVQELGITDPLFETVFDPTGNNHELSDLDKDTVLAIGISQRDDQLQLHFHYRTEMFDADCAARMAGYHVTALELMAADVDAEHERQSLLSADELHFLIEGLAGPKRELPDQRFHELFEQRVETHPDMVAAVYGEQEWTYRELNARANKIGRALLARGLSKEGIVAVVTERNLDWMAAVIAVFKAGGVYLPVEPHFPSDRIAAMLSRSECKLVLTEPDSTTTLEEALDTIPEVEMHYINTIYKEDHTEDNLGIAVEPNQLAYIYFTSGSTGEPKGAMCEHAGMVNHLYAKIDDLEIGEGQVVAQIAPQCFDISLWQLVSALLVGGRTLIVKQSVILDVERFVDTIINGRVSVMQVVPSYLEVVLAYLDEYPRELPDLRCVSVTGEALEKELTQRWFAAMPGIKLVNAYGLTETSDDTNHEVMDRPPKRERVPLGPAVNNVYIYIVDEHLSPVPLGAIGEIVFSGVCVGRGYINDPDRTRKAYMADPIREGERLYRSGDYGRWQPDGKLEFLGRQDAQIKIRGFRIEIGDIENALLGIPGTRRGAVVVTERANQSKHLVAFYSSNRSLEVDEVQEQLSQALPAYMVPSIFHQLDRLPLTDNGKIDRKTLRALALELDTVAEDYQPPSTPTEKQLAAAWSNVLSIPVHKISRLDHFFDLGGTSLSAVRLAIKMDRTVSLRDVTRYPILADLAELVDGRNENEQSSELLQSLAAPDSAYTSALVCFPYAGGNAVNFQSMARILGKNGLPVYAVELPGHDLAAQSEEFVPLSQVVDQVVDEIIQSGKRQVLLWGHSSGAAFALETARKLQEHGVHVQRVFIGAQLIGDATARCAAISELAAQSNAEIAARLNSDRGYTELDELDDLRAEHIGAAYRHDCVSAHQYFADILDNPPEEKLLAPITVVITADDPYTAKALHTYRRWELFAKRVDIYVLDDGGHYFLRTRSAEAAQAVMRDVETVQTVRDVEMAQTVIRDVETATSSAVATQTVATQKEIELTYSTSVEQQTGKPPMLQVNVDGDIPKWATEHRDDLRAIIADRGSILVRGLGLQDVAEIEAVFNTLANGLMPEKEAFSPRRTYSDGVYASTKWASNQPMCSHHELSYVCEFSRSNDVRVS